MTTTDTDALIEKIAHALGKENYVYGPNAQALFRDDAAAVLPIVEAEVRKAKAEAWDECAHEADRRWLIGGQSAAILHDRNPYRETGDPDEHR